jgi:hypothetical protein
MISKLFKYYLDIVFLFYAYMVGYFYIAAPYILGFAIPPIKKTLLKYESSGEYKSIAILSLISGTLWYLTMLLALLNDPVWEFSIVELILWYVGYYFWGFFALFLLADFKKRKRIFS